MEEIQEWVILAKKLIKSQNKEIERLNQMNDLCMKLVEKYQESVELYKQNFENLKNLYHG